MVLKLKDRKFEYFEDFSQFKLSLNFWWKSSQTRNFKFKIFKNLKLSIPRNYNTIFTDYIHIFILPFEFIRSRFLLTVQHIQFPHIEFNPEKGNASARAKFVSIVNVTFFLYVKWRVLFFFVFSPSVSALPPSLLFIDNECSAFLINK